MERYARFENEGDEEREGVAMTSLANESESKVACKVQRKKWSGQVCPQQWSNFPKWFAAILLTVAASVAVTLSVVAIGNGATPSSAKTDLEELLKEIRHKSFISTPESTTMRDTYGSLDKLSEMMRRIESRLDDIEMRILIHTNHTVGAASLKIIKSFQKLTDDLKAKYEIKVRKEVNKITTALSSMNESVGNNFKILNGESIAIQLGLSSQSMNFNTSLTSLYETIRDGQVNLQERLMKIGSGFEDLLSFKTVSLWRKINDTMKEQQAEAARRTNRLEVRFTDFANSVEANFYRLNATLSAKQIDRAGNLAALGSQLKNISAGMNSKFLYLNNTMMEWRSDLTEKVKKTGTRLMNESASLAVILTSLNATIKEGQAEVMTSADDLKSSLTQVGNNMEVEIDKFDGKYTAKQEELISKLEELENAFAKELEEISGNMLLMNNTLWDGLNTRDVQSDEILHRFTRDTAMLSRDLSVINRTTIDLKREFEEKLEGFESELETHSDHFKIKLITLNETLRNEKTELDDKLDALARKFEDEVNELSVETTHLNDSIMNNMEYRSNETEQRILQRDDDIFRSLRSLNGSFKAVKREFEEKTEEIERILVMISGDVKTNVTSLNETLRQSQNDLADEVTSLRAELKESLDSIAEDVSNLNETATFAQSELLEVSRQLEAEVTKLDETIVHKDARLTARVLDTENRLGNKSREFIQDLLAVNQSVATNLRNLKQNVDGLQSGLRERSESLQLDITNLNETIRRKQNEINGRIDEIETDLEKKKEEINEETPEINEDCEEIYHKANRSDLPDGVNNVLLNGRNITVYCKFHWNGYSWMVMQRRRNGRENFNRPFSEYAAGFGDMVEEFWIGLETLHQITSSKRHRLRVDLEDWEGNTAYAEFSSFSVGDSSSNYRLSIDGFNDGGAGDSLTDQNSQQFSTHDRDNDIDESRHCAQQYNGGWWFRYCHPSNLNGEYLEGGQQNWAGIVWQTWKSNPYSMRTTEMKIRPT